MWERIKEFAEKHPIWLGVIVFGVGALLIWLIFGGKSSGQVSTGTDNTGYYNALAAATESGNQLQAAQLQLQGQSAAIQAGTTVQQNNDATQLAITQSNNNAQVQIATAQINEQGQAASLAAQTAQLQSTLQAQVAQQTNDAQLQAAQIASTTNLQAAQIQAGIAANNTYYNYQGQALTAQTQQAEIASNQNIQTQQIQLQATTEWNQANEAAQQGDILWQNEQYQNQLLASALQLNANQAALNTNTAGSIAITALNKLPNAA